MSVTLQDVVDAIQAKVKTLEPALRSAPDNPIEQPAVYPFGVTFIRRVNYTQQSGTLRTGLHTVAVQIHIARKDLPRDIVKAVPYGEALPVALWNDLTLGGKVAHINDIRGAFRAMEWGDQETLGWDFEIDFKMLNQGVA
jgi:hypothetical protein